jgi:hypothetical protein
MNCIAIPMMLNSGNGMGLAEHRNHCTPAIHDAICGPILLGMFGREHPVVNGYA